MNRVETEWKIETVCTDLRNGFIWRLRKFDERFMHEEEFIQEKLNNGRKNRKEDDVTGKRNVVLLFSLND